MCVNPLNTVAWVKEEDFRELTAKARRLIDKALKAASECESIVGMWIRVKQVLNKIRKEYYIRILG